MKQAAWISAYENGMSDIGLECGLSGRAQIGKGTVGHADLMAAMLEQMIAHRRPGRTRPGFRPRPPRRCMRRTITASMSPTSRTVFASAAAQSSPIFFPFRSPRVRTGARKIPEGTGQQCAGDSRLCRALDRPGRRLLQGAGHQQYRPDGRTVPRCASPRSTWPTGFVMASSRRRRLLKR